MLYLLGGTPRSGKTIITRRFRAQTGIPYFCLYYLMMGFTKGLPDHGVDAEDDERKVAELLWPVVKPLATALVEDEVDYMIEGVQLLPRHARELRDNLDKYIRPCFLGFAEVDTREKLRQIRCFGYDPDDWFRDFDEERAIREIERLKVFSVNLRDECREYDLKYFEVSTDIEQTIQEVIQYLRG